ncbi:MAG: GTPase Era [Clostridia bacterium]|nr:GTPase Era [Clostridia bacterium]
MGFRSGFITIVGRPNVGKSTLLNRIMGQKIAIVSAKSQTTRNCIRGIYNTDNCQMVFLDTPGIHKPQNKLGEYMMRTQREAQEGCDAIVAMITADDFFGPTDTSMLENLKGVGCPCYAVINKMDVADPVLLVQAKERLKEYPYLKRVFSISAASGEGVDELLKELESILPEGPAFFPEDMVCDFPERFLAQEVIREKMLELLKDEVPHGVGVQIVKMQERANGKIYILADIFCERKSHKGIIIGKNGAMLRTIGTNARKELEELLEAGVFLELFVKIQEDWRNVERNLKQMGYTDM